MFVYRENQEMPFNLHTSFSDESSSALDAQAEQDLLISLRRLLESDDNNLSAVLFITHKNSNSVMNACDRSIMLSEGRITSD